MRALHVFESITADGYFTGPGGDMTWAYAHSSSPEFQEFVQGNASSPGVLLFGRVTYQMMASYWPTPMAAANNPVVAKGMNDAEKIVFSRTLANVDWANTTLMNGNLVDAVRQLKEIAPKDLVVLGSGSIVSQLAAAGLIDSYQFVVKPVALGAGRTLFEGIAAPFELRLTGTRAFGDGNVVLDYVPAQ